MQKLELKHLAPYLPYGLKIDQLGSYYELVISYNVPSKHHKIDVMQVLLNNHNTKPILRPLSDLTKEIEHNDEWFVPIRHILFDYRKSLEVNFHFEEGVLTDLWLDYPGGGGCYVAHQSMKLLEWLKLFEWHFDVFGLIGKGLAIDKNTIK